ncbi:MAG: choice-of-anchor J domain-containing protein [Cyclobacteriaceae bacterium]
MRYLVIVIIFLFYHPLFAQQRCAVDQDYFQNRKESTLSFEKWLKKKESRLFQRRDFTKNGVYTIPIVVHVIHNGESIGVGTNISDDLIYEQLRIVNEDFRRRNPDRESTPEEFLDFASDTEIEFVLARQNPNGLPTTGIVRKKGSQPQFPFEGNRLITNHSYWPAEDYLNLYVIDISSHIGWASFPFTDIDGIPDINNNRLTDAVFVDYKYFGINPNAPSFPSFGRSLTHEIGHFLGLRHTWGDGGCDADDYCSDTPDQVSNYDKKCPNSRQESCGSSDMYSNYMNYTMDACMNMFTNCQRMRMRTVLESSPRRKSLLSSHALNAPEIISNDLGIKRILSPQKGNCELEFFPTLEVFNYGNNTISSYEISFFSNDRLVETTKRTTTLSSGQSEIITLGPLTSDTDGNNLNFTIDKVNNIEVIAKSHTVGTIQTLPVQQVNIPININFDSVDLTHRSNGWIIDSAPRTTVSNQGAIIDFTNDSLTFGSFEYLTTPILDLTSVSAAELSFSYAYATPFDDFDSDGLIVAVSQDCGNTYRTEDYIFETYSRRGKLNTASPRSGPFKPNSVNDWEEVTINLSRYLGSNDIRIAFIGHNGGTSTLYLDDIKIEPLDLKAYDLGISDLDKLPVVTCRSTVYPEIEISNYGFNTIERFNLQYTSSLNSSQFSHTDTIFTGERLSKTFTIENLEDGTYDLSFFLDSPNGELDENQENDTIYHQMVVSSASDTLPVKQNWESAHQWISTNPKGQSLWAIHDMDTNKVMRAAGFSEQVIGSKSWLVSPMLNTSYIDSLGLFFEYAYNSREDRQDRLEVYVSVTCGNAFNDLIFQAYSDELSSANSNEAFIPASTDWQSVFINLTDYAKWGDLRIAFVFTNGNGNNLYLDNIEFINSSKKDVVRPEGQLLAYPNPVTTELKVALDLPIKDDIMVSLISTTGKEVQKLLFPKILNQTLTLDVSNLHGIYFLKVVGEHINETSRVLIGR